MVKVLQVAVITHINRRARMHQVGKQEIGVELFLGWEVSIRIETIARRIRQNGVVLQNHAQRKLRRDCQFHLLRTIWLSKMPFPMEAPAGACASARRYS